MKIFATLSDVLATRHQLNWRGMLYTDDATWRASPRVCPFLYLEGDEEVWDDIVDDETMLPRLAAEHGVTYFLDLQVFEDVIAKQEELKADSTIDDVIHALNHYREFDSFYWPAP